MTFPTIYPIKHAPALVVLCFVVVVSSVLLGFMWYIYPYLQGFAFGTGVILLCACLEKSEKCTELMCGDCLVRRTPVAANGLVMLMEPSLKGQGHMSNHCWASFLYVYIYINCFMHNNLYRQRRLNIVHVANIPRVVLFVNNSIYHIILFWKDICIFFITPRLWFRFWSNWMSITEFMTRIMYHLYTVVSIYS